jgi:palmitoyltransferase
VGHGNLPHFIRFLIWVLIACSYAFYHVMLRAIAIYHARNLPSVGLEFCIVVGFLSNKYLMPKREIIWTIALFPVVFFVLFTISILTLRVFVNYFEGKTQIETWEIQRIQSLVRRKFVKNVEFPYDLDPWTNIYHAWGSPLLWLWPWGEAPGDGMHFEKNEVVDDGSVWPPDHVDQDEPKEEEKALTSARPATLGYTNQRPKLAPEWQKYSSANDFYRSDQWQNFEGEKISDFGVDVSSITPSYVPITIENNDGHSSSDEQERDDESMPLAEILKKHI